MKPEMMPVRDFMTRNVLTIPHSMDIGECVRLLHARRITGAPVVDDSERVVGVVSVTDLVAALAHGATRLIPEAEFYGVGRKTGEPVGSGFQYEEADLSLVRDIMTPAPFTIPEDAPVREAARAMIENRVHRLLVTHPDGKLAGIVTSLDLLRVLLG